MTWAGPLKPNSAASAPTCVFVAYARNASPWALAVAAVVQGGTSMFGVHQAFLGGFADFGDVSVRPANDLVAGLAAIQFGCRVTPQDTGVIIVGDIGDALEAL